MDRVSVTYYSYPFDASGYGHAARGYIHALHSAGIELSVIDLANRARQVSDPLVESLVGRKLTPDFHLFHGIPPQWARMAFRLPNALGMTVWETDIMPSQWRNILNHVIEVWLPCDFNVSTFRRSLEKPVFKLPHTILRRDFNGDTPGLDQSLGVHKDDFLFYSLFEWQDRKGPHSVIEAYFRAFPEEGDAVLVIKSNPGAASCAREAIEHLRQKTGSAARIQSRCEAWNEAQIEALHRRGDCYVSLHRGEGWGYPLFEAVSRGKPVVATGYSGPLEYLNPDCHHLVRYELGPVRQRYIYYDPRMRWAEPDISHAAAQLRDVYDNRVQARERAAVAARQVQSRFSVSAVGAMARERLIRLLQHSQPAKWRRIERAERASRLAPAIPIPGDWYDQDYFENGLKSNWERGYSWRLFEALFRDTARFLTGTFCEASSYLDAGCAKGFLVKALRLRGKDCLGFDHSRWAIDQADESVKPFLKLAGVDDVNYDRQFDVLMAFSILESLTEEQIVSFLPRARNWIRQALLAVIPSFDDDQQAEVWTDRDQDLSHITIRSRQWWHNQFLRAGWRQDPLHRLAQRICHQHELPSKMGWKLYLYSPF